MTYIRAVLIAAAILAIATSLAWGYEPGTKPRVTPKSDSTLSDSAVVQAAPPASPHASVDSVAMLRWEVMSDLGSDATSPLYRLSGTGGQTATTLSTSGCLADFHGFWQNFGDPCCVGLRGNADWDPNDLVDLSDLTTMVDWLFYLCSAILYCREEADIAVDGVIDISDLSALVDYLFGYTTDPLPMCP